MSTFRRMWRLFSNPLTRDALIAQCEAAGYTRVLRAKLGGFWNCQYDTKVQGKPHYSLIACGLDDFPLSEGWQVRRPYSLGSSIK